MRPVNPMARRRPLDRPYLVFVDGPVETRVLRSSQANNAKSGATWFVGVRTAATFAGYDMGSQYVVAAMQGLLVYRDPSLPRDILHFVPAPEPALLRVLLGPPSSASSGTPQTQGDLGAP